eukprot:g37145.t1
MNVVREIGKLNKEELKLGIIGGDSASWHNTYKHSAYVFVGNLDYRLSEGDLLAVFSQYGEIVDLNLCRNKETGKSMGFAFLAYEDQRSTILAVDNMNGTKLLQRTLRVDHTEQYRRPKKKVKDKDGKEIEVSDSDEEDYDTRRKRIWNYELYDQHAQSGRAEDKEMSTERVAMPESMLQHPTHLMPSSGSAEDQRVKRIMDMVEKRKKAFADKHLQEQLLEEKKKRGEKLPFKGQLSGAALGAMSSELASSKRERDRDRDRDRERGGDREKDRSRHKKESRDRGRRSSRSRSRSTSRGRRR